MPYQVERRYCNGEPRWWYVNRAPGSNDVPEFSAEVGSLVDACALRNMLNSIHPDLMDNCFKRAVSEADAAFRSAAE